MRLTVWLLAALLLVRRAVTCTTGCVCDDATLICNDTRTLDTSLFHDNLRTLAWTSSNIERLSRPLFESCVHLRDLSLDNNSLTELPENLFYDLLDLERLNVSRNRLQLLPRNLFLKNVNLRHVKLDWNRLRSLPFKMPGSQLETLDLSHNLLTSLADYRFTTNGKLKVLKLSWNRLTNLSPKLLAGLDQLTELELDHNHIGYLPLGLFLSARKLRRLDLSNNPITRLTDVSFQSLGDLHWLNLSNTRISHFPLGVWKHVPQLEQLGLRGINISMLNDEDLVGLNNLKQLWIEDTHLHTISSRALKSVPKLQGLFLKNNDLVFLPASLAHLGELRNLELQGNRLACDCRMFWFVKWMETHLYSNVMNNGLRCGEEPSLDALRYLNCTAPYPVHVTQLNQYLIFSPVLLECEFSGNPAPSITWVTPKLKILHWNPDPSFPDVYYKHPAVHKFDDPGWVDDGRIRLMDNGSLYIQSLLREDVGLYKCFATNPISHVTSFVTVQMDPISFQQIKMLSYVVGAASAVMFLLLTLFVQFLRYLCVK